MATNPIPQAELPSAVAELYDVMIEDGRTLRAVERLAFAVAVMLVDIAPDRLPAVDHMRRLALDTLPLFESGATDALREPLERMLATIEAYSAALDHEGPPG